MILQVPKFFRCLPNPTVSLFFLVDDIDAVPRSDAHWSVLPDHHHVITEPMIFLVNDFDFCGL